ncbi:MAG TPA: branched-chain amino acid ABC transporter ATP-binding protein/permease [Candidatus Acidoferrales bacterium]|nr:branched-chain amino acid ABC transporter ATP-binding protein/permease [Candidatus Acidoferrales bacterium]HVC23634.1 branched-chain amino acid ABC transporter ATP-binding protein/permease [Candidatus Dormibacteraeota bacterium]
MSQATLFYLANLLVYGGVDAIACLGLSMQFGVSGVSNFGYIIFQAAGAYTAAVLSLPPDTANGGFQSYIGGLGLPFPIPWIGAALVGGLVALPFTLLVGRRLTGQVAAIGLLVTAVMANLLVNNFVPLFNGAAGLSIVPEPLHNLINPQSQVYQWGYGLVAVLLAIAVYFLFRRLTESPYGRSLRAMRDNSRVADALGKDLLSLRTAMLVLGGMAAGLSGGILVGFITLWSPSAWGYAETIVLFAAVIIGGTGNHKGAILGAILVPLGFEEATRFIPAIGAPGLIPALQWVAIGILIVSFLWFRPQGIIPEPRRRIFAKAQALAARNGSAGALAQVAPTPSRPTVLGRPLNQGGPILSTEGVVVSFGDLRAVDGVSVGIERGRLTGLIGPNGAGKSTLLSALAGTVTASQGRILYEGQDVTQMPTYLRARAGLVRTFQLASEFKRLTVIENLLSAVPDQRGDTFRGALRGRRYWRQEETAAVEEARGLMAQFGLIEEADTYAGNLSGGQRRLVEIMRALMTRPQLLLLDEPMAGIHPTLARKIGKSLQALCGEGMTILLVEHELAFMDEFCEPVVVMAEGRVLAEGTMSQLRGQPEVVEAYLVG